MFEGEMRLMEEGERKVRVGSYSTLFPHGKGAHFLIYFSLISWVLIFNFLISFFLPNYLLRFFLVQSLIFKEFINIVLDIHASFIKAPSTVGYINS